MTIEFKTIPQFTKAIDEDGRTVTGIFAVHGNVDDGNDRSHPGAFADAVSGRNRVRHLWNHGGGFFDRGQTPPIAAIKVIREVTRAELPDAVLTFAPDATGGALVTRTYLDTPAGNEILAGIKAGAIDEMSYAYDVVKATYTETEERFIREIAAMKLFDTSDVNWGMNPATVGSKSALAALPFEQHFAAVLATAQEFAERVADLKRLRETDGRSLSTINIDRVKTLLDQLAPMQTDMLALLTRPDPPKANDDARRLMLEYQRLLALSNGVTI